MKNPHICAIFLLPCLAISTHSLVTQDDDSQLAEEWRNYKAKYNKVYPASADSHRLEIYKKHKKFIKEHNEKYAKGKVKFHLKENHLMDMEPHELHTSTGSYPLEGMTPYEENMNTSYHAPSRFDWRTQGVVSEVKNQATCGSCWAFTTTGVLESHYAIKTGERISLSEQYLIDCDISNRGCTGGNAYLALQFIEKTEIPTEKDYPYQGNDLQFCHSVDKFRNLKVKGIAIVTPTEEKLKEAVARIGPIAVGVDGNHPDFQFYYGGIYSNPYCLSYMPNHAMQVVGYGTENGVDYWIVKNSWGANWGEGGYVRMARNANNNCGIASYPLYPVIYSPPPKVVTPVPVVTVVTSQRSTGSIGYSPSSEVVTPVTVVTSQRSTGSIGYSPSSEVVTPVPAVTVGTSQRPKGSSGSGAAGIQPTFYSPIFITLSISLGTFIQRAYN